MLLFTPGIHGIHIDITKLYNKNLLHITISYIFPSTKSTKFHHMVITLVTQFDHMGGWGSID